MEKNISTQEATISSNLKSLDWPTICKEIEAKLGKEIYESWIKKLKLVEEFQHYLVLSSPTRFIRDWVVSRYIDKILEVIKLNKKTVSRIDFIIESELSINSNNVSDQNLKIIKESNSSNVSYIKDSLINYTRLDPNKNFENFIIGKSNNLAYQASQKVCEQFGHYNPLFIYGGIGMGKTHLLNSIGLKMRENNKVMFISAERFMYHFIKSIQNKEMVKFKDSFRTSDLFIVDDIQFVIGKEAMQEEFFHTFNALIERGSQIVVASDRSPSNLDRVQGRIKSRLSGGLVIDIQPPDLNLRIKILKSKFEDIKKNFNANYNLNDEVFKFLATEITSSIREMVGALNRVLAFSKINTKSPNIYECKRILKDFINDNKKSINVESIQNIVAVYFNLNIQEMLSPRRSRSLARPRQIAMYLAKKYTTNSLPEIGRKFSNRDHTTVIHAVKKIDELIKNDNEIKHSITEIIKILL